jgi:hypothetical protein
VFISATASDVGASINDVLALSIALG